VIIVDGYYEWHDPEHKNRSIQPYFIKSKTLEPLYLGCLFKEEKDGLKFVVITRESQNEMTKIHH